MPSQVQTHIFSVSKLNRFAKHILESEIGHIWLSGEVSNFTAASSGHWYFTLKDEKAQIRSAMFKGNNRQNKHMPKSGDKVLVRGNISLYEPRGDYQLIVSHLEQAGEGLLKQQFEQLKAQLAQEGLFAQVHKKAIPENPSTIGVITSPTGAAWHDIVTVLQRRNPRTKLILYPCQVQGENAGQLLRQAVLTANQRNEVDVLIIGRGGGSMEDLWEFNNEQLARTIFNSEIPIISAVGHEIDFTISDFVADARAATPSAAAEIASAPITKSWENLSLLKQRLNEASKQILQHASHRFNLLNQQLQHCHPANQIHQQQQTLDNQLLESINRWQSLYANKSMQIEKLASRLSAMYPGHQLQSNKQKINFLKYGLDRTIQSIVSEKRSRLGSICHLLDTISPLSTLARGYTLTYKEDELIKSTASVELNDKITTRFGVGSVTSKVVSIKDN